MSLAHAEMVNDGGTADEKAAVKMEIERHVVRDCVAEAGGTGRSLSNLIGVCIRQMEG